jgi:Fe-S cluster biogenesis protein NfuA
MPKTAKEVREDVERVLGVLREGLAMHGGNVELVNIDLETGTASVRMQGACVGCPMSELTLKAGIEETVCQMVPEIKQVIRVEELEPST